MVTDLQIDRYALESYCRQWKIVRLSFFGSVLRPDFSPESDVDVLVEFEPSSTPTLFDLVHMRDDLSALLNRKVDLVSRRGLELSRNDLRKRAILESAQVVYAA